MTVAAPPTPPGPGAFAPPAPPPLWRSARRVLGLLAATTVNGVRRQAGGGLGLLSAFAVPVMMALGFIAMFEVMGKFVSVVRGDMVTFLLTGIYLFLIATRTKNAASIAVSGPMMFHQPVQPVIIAWAGALSTFYVMLVSMALIFTGNYLLRDVGAIQDPFGLIAPLLVTWLFGVGAGMCLTGIARYTGGAQVYNLLFQRAMFVTSGKFMTANSVPGFIRPLMDWNPLFHTIDQMRDAAFVNYTAHTTSMTYPAAVTAGLLLLGHMLERRVRADFCLSGKT